MGKSTCLALPLLMLASCGGGDREGTDIQGTLEFAARSDAEISRIISAAGGSDMFSAQAQVDQFGDTYMPDPCPAIAVAGNSATITGGCTTADGVEIGGSAVVTNSLAWDQYEAVYGEDATYELHQLSFTQSGITQTYDGYIRLGGDFRTWECDLTADTLGMPLRSDITYACGGNATAVTCTISGSGLELIGVGGARLSGTVRTSQTSATSELTLNGVDELTVDIAAGCVSWQIEGTDRRSPPCP